MDNCASTASCTRPGVAAEVASVQSGGANLFLESPPFGDLSAPYAGVGSAAAPPRRHDTLYAIEQPQGHYAPAYDIWRFVPGRFAQSNTRMPAGTPAQLEVYDSNLIAAFLTNFAQTGPRGSGMERHILLATLRPATCLACHDPLLHACTGCHTAAEV